MCGHIGVKGHQGLGYMGGCQNYGPFLGTLNIRCRIMIGTQKGTIILTTTHVANHREHAMENEMESENHPASSASAVPTNTWGLPKKKGSKYTPPRY